MQFSRQPTRPVSPEQGPSSTAGGNSSPKLTPILQDAYDKNEQIAQNMISFNEQRFAKFALEAISLSTIFDKNSDGQKAAFANISGEDHEEAYRVAAAVFE